MHMRLEKPALQPSHRLNMIMMADVLNCRDRGRGWGQGSRKAWGRGSIKRSLREEQSSRKQRSKDQVLTVGAHWGGGGSGVLCKGHGEPWESYKQGRLRVPTAERNVDYGGWLEQRELWRAGEAQTGVRPVFLLKDGCVKGGTCLGTSPERDSQGEAEGSFLPHLHPVFLPASPDPLGLR